MKKMGGRGKKMSEYNVHVHLDGQMKTGITMVGKAGSAGERETMRGERRGDFTAWSRRFRAEQCERLEIMETLRNVYRLTYPGNEHTYKNFRGSTTEQSYSISCQHKTCCNAPS